MAEETVAVCQFVGDPMPDIAGVGILAGFSGQGLLSLLLAVWVFFFSRHGRLDLLHEDGSDEHEIEVRRLEMVRDILMIGNDIQLMTGVALMITAFTSYHKIDLYHLRLIYDTVSFVGVSIAAALVCYTFCIAHEERYHERRRRRATGLEDAGTQRHKKRDATWLDTYFHIFRPLQALFTWAIKTVPQLAKATKANPVIRKFFTSGRYRATYLFSVFFLALTILLDRKLKAWDLAVPGACYHAHGTSAGDATHPRADRVYVWVTCAWMLGVMVFSVFDSAHHRRCILAAAFVQFPLHFYMMLALRSANQGVLGESTKAEAAPEKDETTENEWDFGQTTAMLLLFVAVFEALGKGYAFFKFERHLKKSHRAAEQKSKGGAKEEQVPLNDETEHDNDDSQQPSHAASGQDNSRSHGAAEPISTRIPLDIEANAQQQHQQQQQQQGRR